MFATMQILRTADEHFTDLPEFPYAAKYCDVSDQDGGTLRVFDFCDSRVSPFAVQQDTLMANVPEVRKLGLAVSKPSAVPVMS
jgi:hypothetical protein